jgi:Tfp pilus assembly protein PilV
MTRNGFSLVELLVACALFLTVGAIVALLAGPVHAKLSQGEASAQMEIAGRSALEVMIADVRAAGADAAVADPGSRLAGIAPVVFATRDLESDAPAVSGAALGVRYVRGDGTQARLRAAADAGTAVLAVSTANRCSGGPPACRFRVGSRVVIYGDGVLEIGTVARVEAGELTLSTPLARTFRLGSTVGEFANIAYGLRAAGSGSRRLVRITAAGAEQPLVDDVATFEVLLSPEDIDAAVRVHLRLRLEAPAVLRGPAGYLFVRDGTSSDSRFWMPDVEYRATVTLRNR